MHRALLVSEILVQIFDNLSQPPISEILDTWLPSSTGKSLASLALTCTTFHELAMDLLWCNMLGLRPLLGCVTRLHSVVYDSESVYDRDWSEDVDPLVEHEFHQFLRHSARVRNISISATKFLHLLTTLPIETCVFPNLRSLSWLVQCTEIGDLRFFLPPTLRSCYHISEELQLDMKYIGARCPDMEEFTVYGGSGGVRLSETLRSCKRLKHLQYPPFDSTAWMHLSTIPTLLEVNIFTSRMIHYPGPLDNLDFATFLHLTTLSLSGGIEAASVVAIIQHFKFPSLKKFKVHVRVLPWAEAEQLFRALSLCKASWQTLEHIIISSRNKTQEHTSDSLTAVRQFFCFKELRTLRIYVHRPIYLDDDLLFEAMTTWPHIRLASFSNYHYISRLQELQVLVDARNIDIAPEVESFQHTSLRNLAVDSCELEAVNVEAVARIIYSMLPAVSQVIYSDDGVPRSLHNVNKHLDLLRNKPSSAPDQ
ncbi:uncharacterized protein F5891DRAFT_1068422 [Suillus fuscotomentosus]|uniref:F-box domain-containing protein n=1 Tax=Suillus fuscotomentosus TaxID=1912939 RepID=A0AAD4HEV0_9AGAM|nr:uncharacterized protein F5891DRAFT_1068422 [Suillus fuscotomentosus]KAG1892904.1 hypothetical protein F5891DRAFT_1068422 [Suillus fuscotomentosus]